MRTWIDEIFGELSSKYFLPLAPGRASTLLAGHSRSTLHKLLQLKTGHMHLMVASLAEEILSSWTGLFTQKKDTSQTPEEGSTNMLLWIHVNDV